MRGPALAAWYPRKTVSFRDLQDTYRPLGLTMFDEAEDDREEAIQMYGLPLSLSIFNAHSTPQCEISRKGQAKEEENSSR